MDYIAAIAAFSPQSEQEEADQRNMLNYIDRVGDAALRRESALAHITSSGFILNAAQSKVLFVHHNIRGVWGWTGGHADGDSDLPAVALREAQEETGAQNLQLLSPHIASLDVLPVPAHHRRGVYVGTHLHLSVAYLLLGSENEPLHNRPQENSAVAWLSVADLCEHNFAPGDVALYQKLLARARTLG